MILTSSNIVLLYLNTFPQFLYFNILSYISRATTISVMEGSSQKASIKHNFHPLLETRFILNSELLHILRLHRGSAYDPMN